MAKRWSIEEDEFLRKNYGKVKISIISENLGRSTDCIKTRASKFKLKGNSSLACSTYEFNHNYFDNPTIYNSYWAGFIAADGCLYYGKNANKLGVLKILLSKQDKEILEQFSKDCNYNGKILEFSRILNNKVHKYCYIHICNLSYWADNLKKYWNIVPRKTRILEPPLITDIQQQLAYIIGYIDGDGSIYKESQPSGKSRLCLGISGTKAILEWISHILYKFENQEKYKLRTPLKINKHINNNLTHSIVYTNQRAIRLLNMLKAVPITFRLKRKWLIS